MPGLETGRWCAMRGRRQEVGLLGVGVASRKSEIVEALTNFKVGRSLVDNHNLQTWWPMGKGRNSLMTAFFIALQSWVGGTTSVWWHRLLFRIPIG